MPTLLEIDMMKLAFVQETEAVLFCDTVLSTRQRSRNKRKIGVRVRETHDSKFGQ